MPILLDLFLTFLMIGAVAFGGGYGMIPFVRSIVVDKGWLTAGEISNIIAVAESTPGPIAINMATYVGSLKGGILGSILATVAVVIPAFVIIYVIANVLKKFNNNKFVNAFLTFVKPVVVALIFSTGLFLIIECVFANIQLSYVNPTPIKFDYISLILIGALILIRFLYKKIFKKQISPILLIIISAVAGIFIF
ncbi:MAG: chromate transporter [Clostridia bacterium]|nr:chromate transporter [Clostridia bacterium]